MSVRTLNDRSTPATRRLPAAARREQILDRASELITESGLARLTMKRIAARVGFTETAIYRHFPTKQSLLLGLMGRLETQLLVPARAIAANAALPADRRLREAVQHHLSTVLVRNSLSIQLLAEAAAAGDPVLLSRMRRVMRGYMDLLTGLAREAAATGGVPADADPSVVAMWLLGGPAAMAIQRRLRLDPAVERRVAGLMVPFMFDLLLRSCSSPD